MRKGHALLPDAVKRTKPTQVSNYLPKGRMPSNSCVVNAL